jgi:hypothetical protein
MPIGESTGRKATGLPLPEQARMELLTKLCLQETPEP